MCSKAVNNSLWDLKCIYCHHTDLFPSDALFSKNWFNMIHFCQHCNNGYIFKAGIQWTGYYAFYLLSSVLFFIFLYLYIFVINITSVGLAILLSVVSLFPFFKIILRIARVVYLKIFIFYLDR